MGRKKKLDESMIRMKIQDNLRNMEFPELMDDEVIFANRELGRLEDCLWER